MARVHPWSRRLSATYKFAPIAYAVALTRHSTGLVRTPSVEAWLRGLGSSAGWGEDWEEIERRVVAEFIPDRIGRIGRPEDVAHAAACLARPR